MQSDEGDPAGELLSRLLADAGEAPLTAEELDHFRDYLSLFLRWNARVNLSSIREPERVLSRHFVESIASARLLPQGISTLLDFGSGGGLPGLPIAICRREINVCLAESQVKKAAFLREVVRALGLETRVFGGRAETLQDRFDCVTLRAVDKMMNAVSLGAQLVGSGGWLALMTTRADAPLLQHAAGETFEWSPAEPLPNSEDRVLVLARRKI